MRYQHSIRDNGIRKSLIIADRDSETRLDLSEAMPDGFSVRPGRYGVRFGNGPQNRKGKAHGPAELSRASVVARRAQWLITTGVDYCTLPELVKTVAGRTTLRGMVYRGTMCALLGMGVSVTQARIQAQAETEETMIAVDSSLVGESTGPARREHSDNNPGRLSIVYVKASVTPAAPAATAAAAAAIDRTYHYSNGRGTSLLCQGANVTDMSGHVDLTAQAVNDYCKVCAAEVS